MIVNSRLRQITSEDSEESDGTRFILQKEQELKKLKKQHILRNHSKGRKYVLNNYKMIRIS